MSGIIISVIFKPFPKYLGYFYNAVYFHFSARTENTSKNLNLLNPLALAFARGVHHVGHVSSHMYQLRGPFTTYLSLTSLDEASPANYQRRGSDRLFVDLSLLDRLHRDKFIMGGDAVVHEDHSPLAMRVLVESSAALMSALSVGMLASYVAFAVPFYRNLHLFRFSISITIALVEL
jgi:hypothetical protein